MGWTPSTRPKRRRGEPSRASEPADPLSVTAEEVERAIGSRRDLEIVQVMEAEIAALNESVSTWDASTLSELFSDVSVPSPPIGGVPAEPGCSYAKRVFLEAIEPVLAGTDGAALSGGYWKAQAPGSSVVVPGEPGPDSICVADIMDSAYELAKRW